MATPRYFKVLTTYAQFQPLETGVSHMLAHIDSSEWDFECPDQKDREYFPSKRVP